MPSVRGRAMTRRDLMRRVGRLEQVAGVRLVTLGDGIERGVRVLEFRTGTGFAFDVLVDRSMDVGRCEFRGSSLAWLSPTGVVGPWFAEPMGLGWFRSWGGGMLVTCGLDHTLLGGVDDASNFHQLVKPTEEYGLHGRIGFLPARLTGYGERWEGDECVLWAEGVVRQAAVYGEAMELRRRIEARLGESRFSVRDEVVNVGFDPTTHMYLYHVNVGWPVVDAGSEYLIPAPPGVPVAEYPTRDYRTLTAPNQAFPEECYEHAVRAEPAGTVPVAIVNRALGLGAYQVYKKDQFPFHTMWRMLGEGIYGVAMEPTTNRDAGRFDARERGELAYLAPGEARVYDLEIGVLDGSAAIDAFAARVDALTATAAGKDHRA
ncbi:MAG TPA: aldose 1-epimerase family protein [Candidatus Dormibacteraeota bacterium]|nr:aldose 1-epimerase family protein [Candidatus Dormibacteraeota bacterium]